VKLNDPAVVRSEYASEETLLARRAAYERAIYDGGQGPWEVMLAAIAEVAPRRVLDAGCGPGDIAERIAREITSDVTAIDISPRMVELARAHGLEARVADVQQLPFDDATFDVALAAWMLFHVADLDRALHELRRVLVPGGRLVAVTNSESHMAEARELAGIDMRGQLSFSRENGRKILAGSFESVEQRDVDGWVMLDATGVRNHIGAMITVGGRAELVPDFAGELRVGARQTVFVAEKSA
jgi:SAM-dependent methyltransferase